MTGRSHRKRLGCKGSEGLVLGAEFPEGEGSIAVIEPFDGIALLAVEMGDDVVGQDDVGRAVGAGANVDDAIVVSHG